MQNLRFGLLALALVACGKGKEAADSYVMKSKATEAQVMLNKLGKEAKTQYIEKAIFPEGKAPLTPEKPCCKDTGQQCTPDPAAWDKHEIWKVLSMFPSERHRFQYSYESDGKTVTATAVGDLDCDGKTIEFKLEVTTKDGMPTMTISEPPALD